MHEKSDTDILSCIVGRGVFASREIPAGQFICEYYAELIACKEGDMREDWEQSCFRYFCTHKGSAYWSV